MATTHDVTGDSTTFPWVGGQKCFVIEKEFDCSDTALVSGDTYKALHIPANTLVLHVAVEVTTAEGGVGTVDIGDDSTTNGWCAGIDVNSATTSLGAGAYAGGKVYAVADTLDVLANNALDAAVFTVLAVCFDVS